MPYSVGHGTLIAMTDDGPFDELLRRIAERVTAAGLSERKASLKATRTVDAIQNIKRGHAPRAETLISLATVTKTPEAYFLDALRTRHIDDMEMTGATGVEPDRPASFDMHIPPPHPVLPPGYVKVETILVRPGMGGGGDSGAVVGDQDVYGEPALCPSA